MVKLPAPFSTKDTMASMRALLVGHSGVGKSTNLANMERAYGKGLILSGEKGLSSIADVDIDAYEFTAYETETYDVVDDEGNKSRRRHIRFREARPAVSNRHCTVVVIAGYGQHDWLFSRGDAQSILDQVVEDLAHPLWVRLHDDGLVRNLQP